MRINHETVSSDPSQLAGPTVEVRHRVDALMGGIHESSTPPPAEPAARLWSIFFFVARASLPPDYKEPMLGLSEGLVIISPCSELRPLETGGTLWILPTPWGLGSFLHGAGGQLMVLWPVCKLLVEKQGLSHIFCQRQAIPPHSAVSLQDQPSCIPVGGSGRNGGSDLMSVCLALPGAASGMERRQAGRWESRTSSCT